jgi:predicted amidohydrolase
MAKSRSLSKDIKDIHKSAIREKDILDLAAALAPKLPPFMRDNRIWEGRCDEEATQLALLKHIERNIPQVPKEIKTFLTAPGLSNDDYLRRAYAVLDSVDHLVGVRAHPEKPPIDKKWKDLYDRLLYNGRYNNVEQDRMAVIPSQSLPNDAPLSPQNRIGRRLCFVESPIHPYRIRYRFISLLKNPSSERWRAAVIPAPHRHNLAQHRKCRDYPNPQYDICHNYTKKDLSAFCSSLEEIETKRNIPIAIFPEAALNWEGLNSLHEKFFALSKRNYRTRDHGLQLLLLGHCGKSSVQYGGYNCMTVIKRKGGLAWSQAKIIGFGLTDKIIKRDELNLPLLNNPNDRYSERLEHPSIPEITVADTPFGRFMIAICEDAAHISPSLSIAEQAEVTHLILPVLDKQLRKDGWYHASAKALALNGITTIVANSAFLEQHVRYKRKQSDNDSIGVLLFNNHHRKPPKIEKWDPKKPKLWVARLI